MGVCTIEEAIEDIRQGKMVILVDDEIGERSEWPWLPRWQPGAINFMAKYAGPDLDPTRKSAMPGTEADVRDNTSLETALRFNRANAALPPAFLLRPFPHILTVLPTKLSSDLVSPVISSRCVQAGGVWFVRQTEGRLIWRGWQR